MAEVLFALAPWDCDSVILSLELPWPTLPRHIFGPLSDCHFIQCGSHTKLVGREVSGSKDWECMLYKADATSQLFEQG